MCVLSIWSHTILFILERSARIHPNNRTLAIITHRFGAANAFSHILRLCTLSISLFHCEHGARYNTTVWKNDRHNSIQRQAVNSTICKSKMALSVPKAPGVAQMLKDGARVSKIHWIIQETCKKIRKNHVWVEAEMIFVRTRALLIHVNCAWVCECALHTFSQKARSQNFNWFFLLVNRLKIKKYVFFGVSFFISILGDRCWAVWKKLCTAI